VTIVEALETLPCRFQSFFVVVDVAFHYILPRMPSYPICFLLVAFLLSGTTRQTYFYFT
jgi:hypothetical protein